MMEVLVAGAAPEPGGEDHYRQLLASAPFVIAADAGAEWCARLGRMPDVAVGDFDSAEEGAAARLESAGVRVIAYPAAKDASDLDLAIIEARASGATRMTLTAVSTLRLDHTLAALGALTSLADVEGSIDEPHLAAWALDSSCRPTLVLAGDPGAVVSVFAVGGAAEGVTLEGFTYPLTDARLGPLSSHGLSNVTNEPMSRVSVTDGVLLVVAPGPPELRPKARE